MIGRLTRPLCHSACLTIMALSGSAAPGNPIEAKYQFDHDGDPSVHTFLLKWPEPAANLASIDILNSETQASIQTITVPQERTALIYETLGRDQIIDTLDFNFDHYSDLRVLAKWPYQPGEKYYLVYLFNPDLNQYILHEELSALQGLVVDRKKKMIYSTEFNGMVGAEFTRRYYRVDAAGALTLEAEMTQRVGNVSRFTFLRDIKERQGASLIPVCKLLARAQGTFHRLWGKPEVCEPYTRKD